MKRVVGKCNCVELLSLKKVMSQRLMSLISGPLGSAVSLDMEFVTDSRKFESAVEEAFGHFKIRDDSATTRGSKQQPPSSAASPPYLQQALPPQPLSRQGSFQAASSTISTSNVSCPSQY